MEILSLIFAIIVFCVFIGMFRRLGRIEGILLKMAYHQGAIEKSEADTEPYGLTATKKTWFGGNK